VARAHLEEASRPVARRIGAVDVQLDGEDIVQLTHRRTGRQSAWRAHLSDAGDAIALSPMADDGSAPLTITGLDLAQHDALVLASRRATAPLP
jgi:hypothetical protein